MGIWHKTLDDAIELVKKGDDKSTKKAIEIIEKHLNQSGSFEREDVKLFDNLVNSMNSYLKYLRQTLEQIKSRHGDLRQVVIDLGTCKMMVNSIIHNCENISQCTRKEEHSMK